MSKFNKLNVDDILNESDDDNDSDDDLMMDPDLEKFKQKAGISKNLQSQVQMPSSSLLKSDDLKFQVQQTQQFSMTQTLQQQTYQTSQFSSKPYASGMPRLELSSDSDSSDEFDKEISQLAQKGKAQQSLPEQKVGSYNNNHGSLGKNKEDSYLSGNAINNNAGIADYSSFKNSGVTLDSEGNDGYSEQQRVVQQNTPEILDVIEKNERMNEVGPEKLIEQGNQLLSFDNKFYNVQKKLFAYQDFPEISKKLHHTKGHQFGGIVSALTIVQDYLFIGNSSGIIRVFDTKSQREMKPLMDEKNIGVNKVTCLDISEDGGFLISGYKKGQVALWDLINYKLLRLIDDIHNTDVVNAKIYHMDESENLYAISCEDSGRVQLIRYNKKTLLGGYSSEAQFLFKTRLKGTASLAMHRKNELYPHAYCDSSSIISFGSLNEIVVCTLRPIKEIFQIPRPSFCKEKSIPYIDWGFGLTPSQRERTVPIMAFAWDRLIQLVYINEANSTVEMDGFYYSDQEINSLYFMGDSILFALVNGREIKVLYTTKFYPGHFKFLENARKDDLLNNQFEKVISVTAHAELEKGFEIPDIKSNILQCQTVMNFNQCVKKYKSSAYFMCGKNIVRGKLYSWKEYLDHIKFNENHDWLTVLKVALEIYNGESKGYAKVPDEKEIREGILKGFMKDMIKDSVQQVIYKYNNNGGNIQKQSQADKILQNQPDTYQADSIAIKVAIEFCLSINATFFLFTEIYQTFVDQNLEAKFLSNLEPFILSGQFKKELIPESIVQKLITFYEERKNFKILEKVIQQLDLSDYSQKADLIITCEVNCLISALLYLMSSQVEESLGCMQILNTMLKVMMDAKNVDIGKEDIGIIQKVDSAKKYEIEKSRSYIGYKLLWIIKVFLDGKMFPSGFLPAEKFRIHVYDIVNFISNDFVLDELLLFDCEQFFKVAVKIFQGEPFKLLKEQKEFLLKNPIKGTGVSIIPTKIINDLFLKKCEGNEIRLEHFYRFIITVQSLHEYQKPNSIYQPFLEIDQGLFIKSVIGVITSKKEVNATEEQIIIKAIKNKKIAKDEVEKILLQLEQQMKSMPNIRIYLVEKKKDFVQSFKLNMANPTLRKDIFSWINRVMEKLSSHGADIQPFDYLKETIQRNIRELIAINVEQCVQLLDRWFEDSYQEQLILDELADYPEVQFNYVKKFLNQNEEKIKQTINEASYSAEKKPEAQRYMQYLVLYTKLLCKFQRNEVHEFVKKDYYPINECLELCRAEKIPKAIAELLKRNGNYLESLETYLDIIDKLDMVEMIKELHSSLKQTTIKNPQQMTWGFLKQQKLVHIHEFDEMLNKTVKIAEKNQSVIGEEGWFTILEFLSKYKDSITSRLQANPQQMSTKDKSKLDNLREFVLQRKNLILKLVPTSISLYTLTERLNLDFKQIKDLYDYKVKAVRNNEKYLKLAKGLQEKELLNIQKNLFDEIERGYKVYDNKKCQICDMTLALQIQKVPIKIFHCGHNYHLNCLVEKKCPLQIQSKEELRKQMRTNKDNKKDTDIDDKKERNLKLMQAQAEAAFMSQNPEKALGLNANTLFVKRLEVFDTMQESYGLNKSNFS